MRLFRAVLALALTCLTLPALAQNPAGGIVYP